MITYTEIGFGSEAYRKAIVLRTAVLRKPLGLVYDQKVLDLEFSDHHFAAVSDEGTIVGTLIMTPVNEDEVKMRQFAVDTSCQKMGIGTELVKYAETWAGGKGYKKITLHARETAIPFYLRLNYKIEGPVFMEVTIPHKFMYKGL